MRETVIVGGGPAGAAAAIGLARRGLRPLLLERDASVREKVCGEFLAEDAARSLAALDVRVAELGALPITRAMFAAGSRSAEFRLPFAAWSLPRATLDAALLDAARVGGAEIALGSVVREAARCADGWRLGLPAHGSLHAGKLILATGKHELRGVGRAARGGAIGVKLVLSGDVPEACVTLLVCPGGYAGVQRRPDGSVNLCAALDPRVPGVAEAARSADGMLAHVAGGSALAARLLSSCAAAAPRPMVIAGIPYGFVHRGRGPLRAGDQAAVIPSMCGDGVAMALRSGLRAAEAVAAGQEPATHHAALAGEGATQMRLASALALAARRAPRMFVAGVAWAPAVAALLARRTRLRAATGGHEA